MKFNKFKTLAAATVLIAAGLSSAHAASLDYEPNTEFEHPSTTQAQTLSHEAVTNFFKGVWGTTKDVASTVSDQAKELVNKTTNTQDPVKAKAQTEQAKELMSRKSTNQNADRISSVNDLSVYHPTAKEKQATNVKPNVAKVEKTEKISIENKEEPKIQKAEVQGPITSEDVIKAKDKVIDGVSSFLNKLRSQPQPDNDNTPKPY